MRWPEFALFFVVGFCVATLLWSGVAEAAADPQGHRAGGRFDYVRYDDAMEVLTDTETGQEYLVWYYRDEVEVVPLGTVAEVTE